MIKQLLKLAVGIALASTLACSKKVKPEATEAADPGAGAGGISSEAMSYNAAGSDSGTIDGLNTVHFGYDSATLDGASKETLKGNAAWMKSNSKVTIQIEGHCDSRGSVEYNLALGERRAKSVKDYLGNLGIDANRVTIISYGKEKPLELGDSEAVMSKNRRANFVPLAN
ncbi:MAG: peptidoglycan-associated lipoprotein Pal [Bdellovibrionales bacterium]